MCEPDALIVAANRAACSFLGREAAEVIGRPVGDPEWRLLRVDGTALPWEEHPVCRVVSDGLPAGDVPLGVVRGQGGEIAWEIIGPVIEPRVVVAQGVEEGGDDDQAIYGWRGSDPTYILEFEKRYPGARRYELVRNYRSPPDIISAADSLIRVNTEPPRVPRRPIRTRDSEQSPAQGRLTVEDAARQIGSHAGGGPCRGV